MGPFKFNITIELVQIWKGCQAIKVEADQEQEEGQIHQFRAVYYF